MGSTSAPATDEDPAYVLERGLERFRAGDFLAAAQLLARSHQAAPSDADISLLYGIALFRIDQYTEAESLLRAAASSPDDETRTSARIFLGLIAAARGETDAAGALLRSASNSSTASLAEAGRELLHRTRPRLLAVTLLVRPEFDSNVQLTPGVNAPTAPGIAETADGDVLLLGAVVVRPFRQWGFTLEEVASYRQQFVQHNWSLFANTLGARYRYLGAADRVAIGYDFEALVLGGSLLDFGHAVQAAYRRGLGRTFGIGARYAYRYRDYRKDGFTPFTGGSHLASLDASWGTPEAAREVVVSGQFVDDDAEDAAYDAKGGGARLYGRMRFAGRVDVIATGWFVRRVFDEAASGGRRDWQVYGELSAAADVIPHLGVLAGVNLLRNLSVDQFDYMKLTAWVGLAVGWAGL